MASNRSADDLEKKIKRLQDRLTQTTVVLENPERTKRQLQINLNHIQRHVNAITECETLTSEENPIDYAQLTEDILEKAEEYSVEINGYLEEIHDSEKKEKSKKWRRE